MGSTKYCWAFLLVGLALFIQPFFYIGFDEASLKGRKVVVTGASVGIGREMALYYCRNGAEVVVVSRNAQKLQKVVEECLRIGGKSANYVSADFSEKDEDFYREVVQDAGIKLGGSIDTLILNHIVDTGAFKPEGYYGHLDMDFTETMYNVNFFSYVKLAHFATPLLEKSSGKLVVVGSTAGRVGLPKVAVYSSTKHALFGYFDSLKFDYTAAGSKISITTCVLGSIGTDNARANTKGIIPESMWASPTECAKSIVKGGELRVHEVYFPLIQTYPIMILRLFPQALKFLVENIM